MQQQLGPRGVAPCQPSLLQQTPATAQHPHAGPDDAPWPSAGKPNKSAACCLDNVPTEALESQRDSKVEAERARTNAVTDATGSSNRMTAASTAAGALKPMATSPSPTLATVTRRGASRSDDVHTPPSVPEQTGTGNIRCKIVTKEGAGQSSTRNRIPGQETRICGAQGVRPGIRQQTVPSAGLRAAWEPCWGC